MVGPGAITQKDLASQIGTTPTTLSKYENGQWHINQYVIDFIKREYGVDIRPVAYRGMPKAKKVWIQVEKK